MSVRPGRRLDLTIALGATEALALARVRGRTLHAVAPVQWPEPADDPAQAILDAIRTLDAQLAAALGRKVRAVRATVVLLPPLSDARLVPLPPLRPAEAELVIRRDAARHFVGGAVPRVVGVLPAGGPVMAVAATVSVAEAVRSALKAMGWTLARLVPAHAAWLAEALAGRAGEGPRAVIALVGEAAHVIRIEDGRPTLVRRVPAAWPAEVVSAAGSPAGAVTVLGGRAAAEKVRRAFATEGWILGDASDVISAEEAAARHAGETKLELAPPSLVAERRREAGRLAVRIAMFGGLMLIGAAAAELWGAKLELDALRARRDAIRDDVAPLLALRDSASRLEAKTMTIEQIQSATPAWTRALFDLALLLPEDVHVNAMHARADTLIIEATGDRAGIALQALRRAGSLTDLRLMGSIERELEDGATAQERFRIRAVLKPPIMPPTTMATPESDPRITEAPPVAPAGNELARREL